MAVWAGDQRTYVVKKNDTLSGIAASLGFSPQELARYNGLRDPDRLKPGQTLQIPPKPGIASTYVVQEGDVLQKIARAHGVDTADLITFNELSDPDKLTVGQELLIPFSASRPAGIPQPTLDPAIRRQIDKVRVKPGRWKYIVVHHSASKRGNAKNIDRYHREERHMENGLAYHFVIGNGHGAPLGGIEIGNRWKRQIKGGHLASEALNAKSIGICLIGNFEVAPPSKQQMDALVALTRYLQKKCGIPTSRVKTHTQINTKPTKCPGRFFPTRAFMARL